MFDSTIFNKIFASVLHEMILDEKIDISEIKEGVREMASLYAPNPQSLQTETVTVPNFNFASHRCAYLHKYAAFHSALVYDMMLLILQNETLFFERRVNSGNFKLCSLGGGPGSDAIGVLTALNNYFNNFRMGVTIVDIMELWRLTFASVVNELRFGHYGSLQNIVQNSFEWNYIGANLLSSMTNPVNRAIAGADFITMVKFVSAAACQDTENMLKKIFKSMKSGAMVLFIDNAAGGFNKVVQNAAQQSGLITKFGPLQHYLYTNESLKVFRFGYSSCFETRVVVHLLQKTNAVREFNAQRNVSSKSTLLNINVMVYQPSSSLNYNTNSFSKNYIKNNVLPSEAQNSNVDQKSTSDHVQRNKNENYDTASQIYASSSSSSKPSHASEANILLDRANNTALSRKNSVLPSQNQNSNFDTKSNLINVQKSKNSKCSEASYVPMSASSKTSHISEDNILPDYANNTDISSKNAVLPSQIQYSNVYKKSNLSQVQRNKSKKHDGASYIPISMPPNVSPIPISQTNILPNVANKIECSRKNNALPSHNQNSNVIKKSNSFHVKRNQNNKCNEDTYVPIPASSSYYSSATYEANISSDDADKTCFSCCVIC